MNIKKHCHSCGALLNRRYFEGRERLYCDSCDLPMYENPIPATAAVLKNERDEILLVKRNSEPKIGQWCLPGGFLELDESPESGCLRELKEETGLEGEIMQWAGNVVGTNPFYKSVLVVGYSVRPTGGTLQAGDDCDEAAYFSVEALPPIAFRSHRQILAAVLENRSSVVTEPAVLDLDDPGCFGAYVITSGDHVELARRACEAGARVLQYRDKKASRLELFQNAREIAAVARRCGTLFIVNDYIDIALMVGADGVHLGQDDIPIADARRIVPVEFIIGKSTHSLAQAVAAQEEGADYIGCGPLFATPTKEDYIPIGIETLKTVLSTVHIPVVAIGGINLENLDEIRNAGAKNVAMVREFQNNTAAVIDTVHKKFAIS